MSEGPRPTGEFGAVIGLAAFASLASGEEALSLRTFADGRRLSTFLMRFPVDVGGDGRGSGDVGDDEVVA